MVTTLFADVTPLLEAAAASDEARVISETLELLGPQRVPPAKLAGRVGLAALWGGAEPRALAVLAVTGRVAEWIRGIPLGPEPGSEERRQLAPALPIVQGILAVAPAIRGGMGEEHPALPDPLLPAEVKSPDGPLGGMRDALSKGDVVMAQRILMGYHATGADYRSLLATLYGTLAFRYPEGGQPLVDLHTAGQTLDMAEWGGNMPALIAWYTPLMMDRAPDAPAAQAARAYAAANDLSWLRKRLAVPKEEAAGPDFQRAVLSGDATAACDAVQTALRQGATPLGIAAGLSLAVAGLINAAPEGDRAALLRAGQGLRYVHAVHAGMAQFQDPHTWPILYTAAAAVSALGGAGTARIEPGRAPAATGGGGLIAPTMLRSLGTQVGAGDAATALATARRYAQMGHPPRPLAGVLGEVAATRDATSREPEAPLALPLVAAAAAEYLMLPPTLQSGGQNALLPAAIRLASELRGTHAVADRVRAAIDARLAGAGR